MDTTARRRTTSGRRSRRAGAVVFLLAVIATLLAVAPPAAQAAPRWVDGQHKVTKVTNCYSTIIGPSFEETGIEAFVGTYADYDSSPMQPFVGQQTYLRLFVISYGDHCGGGVFFSPKVVLPAGVRLDRTGQIFCYLEGARLTHPADCPQWSNVDSNGRYYSTFSEDGGNWFLPNRYGSDPSAYLEFQFPIVSDTLQSNTPIGVELQSAPANTNHVMLLTSNLNVFIGTPDVPRTVAATATSSSTARVTFTAPATNGGSPITDYDAECVSTTGGASRSAFAASSPVDVTGLSSGHTYKCRARANNSAYYGVWSAYTSTFTTPAAATVPGAPTNVSANATSSTTANVSYSAPASNGGAAISSYGTECTSATGGTTRTATGASSPLSVTGLSAGHSYACRVRATNSAGPGSWSNLTNTFTTPAAATAPGRPTAVTATVLSPRSIRVGFTPPASNGGSAITTYRAQCLSSDGGTTRTVDGAASPITISNLTPARSYKCRVRATNTIGDGLYSAYSPTVTLAADVPDRPTNVKLKIAGSTPQTAFADLTFTAPVSDNGSPITSYRLQCISTDGGVTRYGTSSGSPIGATGLTPGKGYHCRVRATNAVGDGTYSTFSTTFRVPG
ncbi:fibronectin type III domain-containing protein [Nocardioides stalactiti]|uniref:fibronectin type III domain-containing protein n=1 Tax=Nocardioides stalactiti TaxID=2755356 RepID=UPI0015FF12D0|nr:fibronectin type III domain-containing protein [Nocardioides stalactiti]